MKREMSEEKKKMLFKKLVEVRCRLRIYVTCNENV